MIIDEKIIKVKNDYDEVVDIRQYYLITNERSQSEYIILEHNETCELLDSYGIDSFLEYNKETGTYYVDEDALHKNFNDVVEAYEKEHFSK